MSRGNQREVDRARAQKRAAGSQKKGKKKDDGNATQALTNKKESYVSSTRRVRSPLYSTVRKAECDSDDCVFVLFLASLRGRARGRRVLVLRLLSNL